MTNHSPLRLQHTEDELRQALARTKDERHKTRIRAIIHIAKGATHRQVTEHFMVNKNTVTGWVSAYNEGGISALDMSKGGRPKGNHKWDQSIFDELAREIDKGGRYWSIPLMQEWLKKHKNQDIPESTVWYHIDRLNYSHKSARP
ncbi:MAG: helix-turn-helix domain-containing protein, partial [Candidatus Pacebacteria bacterium]|nr:helix-turn-helix domain-containing protein [Candidatus Paceibacterota bacterium]